MKFVIVGGDAAGMSAASRAKRLIPKLDVTVLEQTGDVSYSACNMPYNIADPGRSMDDLVVRPARVFREKQGIDLRTGHQATAIDVSNASVTGVGPDGRPFQVPFDRLLIATGASPILPDLQGIDLPGVMPLKSLGDGRAIKNYLTAHRVARVVILGMGYISLEMSEALRALDIHVEMVKPRPHLLPWMDRDLADMVTQELIAHGVVLHTGCPIHRIESHNSGFNVVAGDRQLSADMVLAAVGVRPNSELAADAGIALGPAGAVAVNLQMQTSVPSIYAAGDCADAFHRVSGDRTWIPLALRANRAGWAVADHLSGHPVALTGVVGTAVFKVFDLQVARTGLTAVEAQNAGFDPQSVTIETISRSGFYPGAAPMKVHMTGDAKSGRLLGVQMVGRESAAHRINAAAVALHAHMTVEEFIQCDLAYAPPFGGVWDPLLIAANQLIKKI